MSSFIFAEFQGDVAAARDVLNAKTAHDAKKIGSRMNQHLHPSWDAAKSLVMDVVLFQKFSQANDRCQLLLGTRDRPLWECTKDKCWGWGSLKRKLVGGGGVVWECAGACLGKIFMD